MNSRGIKNQTRKYVAKTIDPTHNCKNCSQTFQCVQAAEERPNIHNPKYNIHKGQCLCTKFGNAYYCHACGLLCKIPE